MKKKYNDFVNAMDNYFTLPKVFKAPYDEETGFIGTATYLRSWSPIELKQVSDKDCTFNDFNYTTGIFGTLCTRWMDNRMMFYVSTIHHTGQKMTNIIKRKLRKPRKNQEHVDKV